MPDFPIVDAHVHLIDPARVPLSWGESAPAINRPHLPADLDAARGDTEIEAFTFIEVDVVEGRHIDEAQMVSGIAQAEPRLKAIVAHAPVHKGRAVDGDLAELARIPLMRGIRRLLQQESDPEFCLRPEFLEGLSCLPAHGLHFEICIYHHQLAAAVEMVRRCENVTFMLDHIAKPGIRDGLREPWARGIREMAALPNVACKVSGVVTEADHANWKPDQLDFYIHHVIDSFGFDRVCFGSDWPVVNLAADHRRWIDLLDTSLRHARSDELRRLYRDNALGFYRMAR
ncbi:MAG: amidohydrolase family protein [Geminicoccaceae bacterium]|nr:amidohydrolase family protein [Geminicoccaceae bacterium]